MKNLFASFILLFAFSSLSAQLVNNGATIVIESGAKLIVETDVTNSNSGVITIAGTGELEIQGNLVNSATITANSGSIVRFSGSNNSDVTSGGAQFSNVEMSKDGTTETVTLLDEMTVDGTLEFVENDNRLVLGTENLTFTSNGNSTLTGTNSYIQADGSGMVVKEVNANGSFMYHIGDATDYTPLNAVYTGSGYTSASISVNTVSAAHPSLPVAATDFIERYWNVNQSGITGYDATLTGTYVNGDITGGATETDITGASYDGTIWSYDNSSGDDVANTITADVDGAMEDFTGSNSFGRTDLKLFLQGAVSGSTMTTSLNNAGLIPLTSPYDPSVTVSSIPANVTDWIKLEVRDSGNPATITSSHSAFVRNDGVVLDLDGTVAPLLKNAASTGYIAVKHRNHLAVRTPSVLNLSTGAYDTHDFSTSLGQAYDNPSITSNDPMIQVGSLFALHRGNANGDNFNNIIDAIFGKNNSTPNQSNVYDGSDVNLDSNINVVDAIITKSGSTPNKQSHN